MLAIDEESTTSEIKIITAHARAGRECPILNGVNHCPMKKLWLGDMDILPKNYKRLIVQIIIKLQIINSLKN